MNLESLNRRFAIKDHLAFKEVAGGLIVAEVDNRHATATICLQGGHVMTWRPKTQDEPVVWLSKFAKLAPGKSIRGGVPICWPWFGPHGTDSKLPAHGFARTVAWELTDTRTLDDGATAMVLTLVESEPIRALWPQRARLSVFIVVGPTLKAALTTTNLDDKDIVIGEALHTYFHIGDIGDIRITGLEDCEYLDKVGGRSVRRRQEGAITFSGETDRIYLNTESVCVIEDSRLRRRIRVAKSGSRSTVVWSPWAEKADKMGDFGPDGWRGMVCVESANAAENVVTVKAGAHHALTVEYRAEGL